MIHYIIPYSLEKNIGKYYNHCFSLVGDNDYICFLDGDAVFTRHDWGHHISNTVRANPEYDLFTCMTNRVGTGYQCVNGMWDQNDFNVHWEYGSSLNGHLVEDITHKSPISGVMILLSKKAWSKAGGFAEGGMLGIDNSIHYHVRNQGGRVGLMKSVYVFHYYRGGNRNKTDHLK